MFKPFQTVFHQIHCNGSHSNSFSYIVILNFILSGMTTHSSQHLLISLAPFNVHVVHSHPTFTTIFKIIYLFQILYPSRLDLNCIEQRSAPSIIFKNDETGRALKLSMLITYSRVGKKSIPQDNFHFEPNTSSLD